MAVTNYIWDEVNDTLLMEKDEAGNTTAAYTYEPGQFGPLISQRRDGQTRYHHYDGQGSTRALTDESGTVTDTYTYTAFGETVASTGTATNPFGYKGALGYYVNPETSDLYVRARTYEPRVARWASRDPVLRSDRLNAYVCLAINFHDASGRFELRLHEFECRTCGRYSWKGKFILDGQEQDGFVIQRITELIDIRDCCGGNTLQRTTGECPGYLSTTPGDAKYSTFYELWTVSGGKVYYGKKNVGPGLRLSSGPDWDDVFQRLHGAGENTKSGKPNFLAGHIQFLSAQGQEADGTPIPPGGWDAWKLKWFDPAYIGIPSNTAIRCEPPPGWVDDPGKAHAFRGLSYRWTCCPKEPRLDIWAIFAGGNFSWEAAAPSRRQP
jgi:RHS repeat-associated protein